MGQKLGGLAVPFFWGELAPHRTQCRLSRGLPPYQVASSIQPFCHNGHWPKIGGLCPFRGGGAGSPFNTMSRRLLFGDDGAWSPSNTLWPGTRPTSVPSGILIHPAVWSQQTWAENWGCCVEVYLRTKWYLDPSSRLATMHGPKTARCSAPCLFLGGAGSPSNTMSPGPRHISAPSGSLIHLAVWTQQTLAENFGVLCPFGGGDSWSPAYTLWSWPRPTSVLSFVLIHPTV